MAWVYEATSDIKMGRNGLGANGNMVAYPKGSRVSSQVVKDHSLTDKGLVKRYSDNKSPDEQDNKTGTTDAAPVTGVNQDTTGA